MKAPLRRQLSGALYKLVQRDYPRGLSIFLNLLCTAQEHERFSKDPAYRAAMDIAALSRTRGRTLYA